MPASMLQAMPCEAQDDFLSPAHLLVVPSRLYYQEKASISNN